MREDPEMMANWRWVLPVRITEAPRRLMAHRGASATGSLERCVCVYGGGGGGSEGREGEERRGEGRGGEGRGEERRGEERRGEERRGGHSSSSSSRGISRGGRRWWNRQTSWAGELRGREPQAVPSLAL